MASVDLVFVAPLVGAPHDLVFGADRTGVVVFSATIPAPTLTVTADVALQPTAEVSLAYTLTAPTLSALLGAAPQTAEVALAYTLPAPVLAVVLDYEALETDAVSFSYTLAAPVMYVYADYDNATPNRMHSSAAVVWQDGAETVRAASTTLRNAAPAVARTQTLWGRGAAVPASVGVVSGSGKASWGATSGDWTDARPVSETCTTAFGDLLRRAHVNETEWREALAVLARAGGGWQDRIRDPRPATDTGWQDGAKVFASRMSSARAGAPTYSGFSGRWTEAMRPPPGYFVVVPPLPREKCYNPPFGNAVNLVFREGLTYDSALLFVCDRLVEVTASAIIPVRRVYVVLNTVRLWRVDGNTELDIEAFTLTADADSWTFGFTATMPESELAHVEPALFGSPVELDADINGQHFRLLVERIVRDRAFAKARITVSGRGISAMLAAPYSPVRSVSNSQERTAQQLVNDALTTNGVSIGYSVDWRIDDWAVPAGAFSRVGTYMDVVNAVVGAAGAYVQPHPTSKTLLVLPRYPVAPWEYGTAVPDLELPSAAVEHDGISWEEKPEYNAVYISGVNDGIIAQVKRAGSAGDKVAPMVVDNLITAAAAARQRGIAVLGNTGRIATVSLTLPVLPESGVILPGKLVRYMDGATPRLGVSRGVNVSAGFPTLRQTVELEVH